MLTIRNLAGAFICLALAGPCSTIFAVEPLQNSTTAPVVISTGTPAADTRTNLEKLSDPKPSVRRNAAILLGSEKKKANVPALVKLLEDENVEVRRAAVNALAITGDKSATVPLVSAYKTEANINVKMNIIIALGDLKGQAALPLLKNLLKDPYPVYRSEALRALGKINVPETREAMVAMLDDEAEGVRIMAADVVATLKLNAAAPLLVKNLKDPVSAVRRSCAQALGAVGSSGDVPALQPLLDDKDPSVAAVAKESIGKIEQRAAEQQKAVEQPKSQQKK